MALLSDDAITARAERKARARVITAGTKLSRPECDALANYCRVRATNSGDLIRSLILREIYKASAEKAPDPMLTEIVGLRLLLHNVLKPLAAGQKLTSENFDALVLQVRRNKAQAASDLLQQEGVR